MKEKMFAGYPDVVNVRWHRLQGGIWSAARWQHLLFQDREHISPICCGTDEELESSVRAFGKHGDSEPTSGNNGKFRKWEYGIL